MQIAGAVLGLMAAKKSADVYKMQAESYKQQAKMATIEADQKEVERIRVLNRQLSALGTSMSSQSIALGTSASVSALRKDEIKMAKSDVNSIRLMGLTNRRKYEISAAGSQASAKATMLGGGGRFAKSMYSINNPNVGVG